MKKKQQQQQRMKRSLVIVRSLSWGEFWAIFSGNKTPNHAKGLPTPRWMERAPMCLFSGRPWFPPPGALATNERGLEEADNRRNSAAPPAFFSWCSLHLEFSAQEQPCPGPGKKSQTRTHTLFTPHSSF